jgi:hypothetical protein
MCRATGAKHHGTVFTITDKCSDVRGGDEIGGGLNVVKILNPTSFTMVCEIYRHCGTKEQFLRLGPVG